MEGWASRTSCRSRETIDRGKQWLGEWLTPLRVGARRVAETVVEEGSMWPRNDEAEMGRHGRGLVRRLHWAYREGKTNRTEERNIWRWCQELPGTSTSRSIEGSVFVVGGHQL